jgi:Tfp pilus assembly protein PilF
VETAPSDPAEIYRRAEEFFVARQYAQAAQLYEQLLAFSADDAEIYNNLGLTLFYLGRPDEALARLDEGVAKDPDHQRIWLTLGYVNSQLGNIEEARAALTRATETGGNASISEAAMEMLAQLP